MMFPSKKRLTQELIIKMLNRTVQKARDFGIYVSVAIVDDGGNLTGFIKMNGVKLLPSRITQNKAYTAGEFGIPTSD